MSFSKRKGERNRRQDFIVFASLMEKGRELVQFGLIGEMLYDRTLVSLGRLYDLVNVVHAENSEIMVIKDSLEIMRALKNKKNIYVLENGFKRPGDVQV